MVVHMVTWITYRGCVSFPVSCWILPAS